MKKLIIFGKISRACVPDKTWRVKAARRRFVLWMLGKSQRLDNRGLQLEF